MGECDGECDGDGECDADKVKRRLPIPKPPKLPILGKRNMLITSALPDVNKVPHLGSIISGVLSADVFARYCRLRGYNIIYICGTDEYGTTTETVEDNCSHREICDKYHAIHKEVYDWFNISFDEFGHTSTPEHTEVCQAIFKKLLENNLLSESTMQQPYCDSCQKLLTDRLVEGTCPTPGCNYQSARGDQCESCGKLLNPTELKDPKCKVCQSTPHICDTDHLFLELPLLKDKLEEYINKMSVAGSWSKNAILSTNALLGEGLKQRCITRDLKWGVPVLLEKFKNKVFYVWFDAPIGYISITKCYTPDWEQWWKNPENVELYQFMAKDNVPFHTVIFPSTLIGTGENWTMMKTISVTEYLNCESGKFSKSKGLGVFGNDAKNTDIPVEVWRYYLLANRPEVSNTLFTWPDLQAKLNGELRSNLGYFINQVLSFIAKPQGLGYGSIIPDATGVDSHALTTSLCEKVGKYVEQYVDAMEKVKLSQGLNIAMSISGEGNDYLQESQFQKLYKEDQPSCSIVMRTATGLVYLLACLLEPFMPSISVEVLKQLNLHETQISLCDEGDIERSKRPWEFLSAGHKIGTPEPLFKEMKNDVELYSKKFAGSQADRPVRAEAEAVKLVGDTKKTKIAAPRMTFEEYKKSNLLPSEPIYDPCDPNLRGFIKFKPAKVLKNSVRILIKSIVNDLRRHHNLGHCMEAINSKTIIIVNGVAFLDGAPTKYTDDGAKKNYIDVAAFIEVAILNGRKDIPYSLTHFLELIRDDPRNNVDFIKYHYSILPNHLRGTFISNCVLAGRGLKGTLGDQAHDTTRVMSNLFSFHDWPSRLPGSGCLRDACKPAKGEENTPYGLLDFHRYIVDHLGERIPMFDEDDSSYVNWYENCINSADKLSVKDLLGRFYTTTIKEPEMKLGKALSVLESLFPEFMTSFQVTLHSKNMLKDLGINPSCDS